MQEGYILPIREPLLKAYLHIGMPFSMLPEEFEKNGWVYNTYIQLVYHDENPADAFMDFTQERFWEEQNVFTKGFFSFPAGTDEERMEMLKEWKRFMNMGYYIFGDWDEYYIPDTPFYEKSFFRHYFFAYGYENNEICVEGYLADGHWHRFRVDEEVFLQAILSDKDRDKNGYVGVNFYRPRESRHFRFDPDMVKKEVKAYLGSKGENAALSYGVSAMRKFFEQMTGAMGVGADFPIQSVYIIYEHKLMMLKRIEYMASEEIGCTEEDVQDYKKVVDQIFSVVCSCVKYRMARKLAHLNKVSEKINDAVVSEQKILRRIFNE